MWKHACTCLTTPSERVKERAPCFSISCHLCLGAECHVHIDCLDFSLAYFPPLFENAAAHNMMVSTLLPLLLLCLCSDSWSDQSDQCFRAIHPAPSDDPYELDEAEYTELSILFNINCEPLSFADRMTVQGGGMRNVVTFEEWQTEHYEMTLFTSRRGVTTWVFELVRANMPDRVEKVSDAYTYWHMLWIACVYGWGYAHFHGFTRVCIHVYAYMHADMHVCMYACTDAPCMRVCMTNPCHALSHSLFLYLSASRPASLPPSLPLSIPFPLTHSLNPGGSGLGAEATV